MGETLVQGPTTLEFFREQLERAMQHQRVSTSAFTQFYLVNLLATCLRAARPEEGSAGFDDAPLALTYARALRATRHERARLLRGLGDSALFTAGFFGDSLARRLVDFHYYRALGGNAYARLSEEGHGSGFPQQLFGELASRFSEFAELLAEISEGSGLATQRSIVQLYERWLHTGSRRAARLLAAQGITPLPASDGRPQ
jgi:hypothetical protein